MEFADFQRRISDSKSTAGVNLRISAARFKLPGGGGGLDTN